ncbi:MAG: flavodoxin-dependent (E)-4-hydroxy-3-methylbut-2-enyl-diphosphate synthase [Pseudomonadota bacterium]
MSTQIKRKSTQQISVGEVKIGGYAPVSVQSMANTFTYDVAATVDLIHRLETAGCEIIRVAVPDKKSADAIRSIKSQIHIPLVADIHFDHRLAIEAIHAGADAVRINPGNLGGAKKVKAVVESAKAHNIPIRVGVNSGSLEKDLLKKYGTTAEAMTFSALRNVDILKSFDFNDIKISLKSSDVLTTVEAYRLISDQTDIPLHLGVTEAGTLYSGAVKSALGIGMLLADGIGDTIRVSLTRDPAEEVRIAYEILKALKIRQRGPKIISCPTCGRCQIDLFKIVEEVESAIAQKKITIQIAIMGCIVNGPGEAKHADIGVAGGKGMGILFRKGRLVRKIKEKDMVKILLDEIERMEKEN